MGKLSNRTALVTGAGSGLGRAITLTFAKNGATVILNGRREEKLREVAKEIGNKKAIVIPADLTVEDEVKQLFDKLKQETGGKLNILVNNAGGMRAIAPSSEMTLEQWQGMLDLNATSQFLTTKYALPLLRESENAKLISVTSGIVNFFMEGMGAYSAGKGAAEALMKTVAVEEEKNNIQVNMFDPLNFISEGNPDGAHDPMDLVGVLVDLAAASSLEKHGEIIKPDIA